MRLDAPGRATPSAKIGSITAGRVRLHARTSPIIPGVCRITDDDPVHRLDGSIARVRQSLLAPCELAGPLVKEDTDRYARIVKDAKISIE